MVDGGTPDSVNPEDRLAESRRQFVTSLGERMQVLSAALESLAEAPGEPIRRGSFQRRVHALGTACTALGFYDGQAAIARIETLLGAMTDPDTEGRLEQIARLLDMVPTMVLGGDAPLSVPPPTTADAPTPISAVFFGLSSLAAGFETKAAWEVREVANSEGLIQALREAVPDVLIVDAAMPHAEQIVEQVLEDPAQDALRVVVVGVFERPEAAAVFLHAGVHRVLPKPLSPATLERHVRELCQRTVRSLQVNPLGEITLDELLTRINQELRRGLLESAKAGSREVLIPFGAGVEELAAVWGAVARMRALIGMRSAGAVAFESGGPEGAITLAPWGTGERNASAAAPRAEGAVSLSGRRVIVADDDPAVAWFIGGVLREAGAEVVEAADGQAALELAHEQWPDLIISDLLMPRLDGFELCRRIKRDLVLSDVPVVVLSWKEDLLQRVRELGAGADGYLQKEANGSVITRSLREVLHTRSRIEERFRKNPEVRGRLDNVAPRLVIELAAKLLGNASVVLRDAAYLYEVELRSGRIATLQRTDAEGRSEQGVELMGPLLGVRVGRFAVRRSSRSISESIDGRLSDLAQVPVARARAAQSLLCAPALKSVGRIGITEHRVSSYLALAPARVRTVAAELLSGVSPTELIEAHGDRVVEVLLNDLVLHDGISEIYDQSGEPLLSPLIHKAAATGHAEPLPPRRPASSASLNASSLKGVGLAAIAPAKTPSFGELLAIAAPSLKPTVQESASGTAGPSVAHNPLSSSRAASHGERKLPEADIAALPMAIGRIKLQPAADAIPRAVSVKPKPPPVPPRPVSAPPGLSNLAPRARDSVPELELGEAMIEQLLSEDTSGTTVVATEPVPQRPAPVSTGAPVAALQLSSPTPPGPEVDLGPSSLATSSPQTVAASHQEQPAAKKPSGQRPAYVAPVRIDESPMDAVMQSLTGADEESIPLMSERATRDAAQTEGPIVRAPGHIGAFESILSFKDASAKSAIQNPPRGESGWQHEQEIAPSARPPDVIRSSQRAQQLENNQRVEPENVTTQVVGDAARDPAAAPASIAPKAKPLLLFMVAATVAFCLMLLFFGETAEEPEPPLPRAAQLPEEEPREGDLGAGLGQGPRGSTSIAVAKSGTPATELITIDRELPADISLTPGKGLLEVSTTGKHRIYIDGVFVGPGPLRRVPLSPGPHAVKVSLDGVEHVTSCEIREGRRTVVEQHPENAQQ